VPGLFEPPREIVDLHPLWLHPLWPFLESPAQASINRFRRNSVNSRRKKCHLPNGTSVIHEQDEIIQQFPRPAAAIQAGFEQGAKCLVATKDVARKQYFLVMQPGSRL